MRAWLLLAASPVLLLCLFNVTVAFFGNSRISPLSPFFLEQKFEALTQYARHRPHCLVRGHGDLGRHVEEASARHRLPPGLLAALVQVESGTNPHRISRAGAMGPGQLMPGTARMLRVTDPFDPAPSIDGSARYLAQQLRRYEGNVTLAVAAYNAGPGAVKNRVPQNGETEHYVRKVMREWERRTPRPATRAKVETKLSAGRPVEATPHPLGRASPQPAEPSTATTAGRRAAPPEPRPR